MDCEQSQEMLVADMAQELPPEDRAQLHAHLNGCPPCQAVAQALREQDVRLRKAFLPRRQASTLLANRVIEQLARESSPLRRPRRWLSIVAAAAAGFLLAVVLFRPWQREVQVVFQPVPTPAIPAPPTPAPDPIRNQTPGPYLTVASHPIETRSAPDGAWQPVKPESTIPFGTAVRTGRDGRCEFRLPDGSLIRLNDDTEVAFPAERQIVIHRGQLLSRVAAAPQAFSVRIPNATVTALGTEFDVACSDTQTVLTVLEGATKVDGAGRSDVVITRERAIIVKGQVVRKVEVANMVQATSWVHEILKLKGRDNPELAERMNDILAQIGEGKVQFLGRQAILDLGDHAVLPLTRYLQSDRSQNDRQRRLEAADLLATLAQPWSIPDLIRLLADKDPEVRFQAARGLERLTKQTFGHPPQDWRRLPWPRLEATYQKWQRWWQENKQRIPEAP